MRFAIAFAIALSVSLSLAQSSVKGIRQLCGSDLSAKQIASAEASFAAAETKARRRAAVANRTAGPSTVQVYWHVISSGSKGNLSDSKIKSSISESNKHFNGTIKFALAGITRTDNSKFFDLLDIDDRNSSQISMKSSLRQGSKKDLNIYSVGSIKVPDEEGDDTLGDGVKRVDINGYATFPNEALLNLKDDGVVVKSAILPRGTSRSFNKGKVLTHEIGHWLGLYHTFAGGCGDKGDMVSDTNPQLEPTYDCTPSSTCPGGLPDPIHNYMGYSSEDCLTEFTPGQVRRFKQQIKRFRGIF